jgi:hypothetical protein
MAGYRKQNGRRSRAEGRRTRMRTRLASAPTAEAQAATAWDWFRMALRWGGHEAEALALYREKTTELAAIADAWDLRAIREGVRRPEGGN